MFIAESPKITLARSIVSSLREDPVYLTSYVSGTGVRVIIKKGRGKKAQDEKKRFQSLLRKNLHREGVSARIIEGEPCIEDVFMALQAEKI
jgi:hypothetical protein